MKIIKFEGENFRNLESFEITPKENNLIIGDNAQGKTNLIEALWLFTGFRSFRSAKDEELINFNSGKTKLKLHWHNDLREVKAEINIINTPNGYLKKAWYNNVALKNSSALIGKLKCCVFSPSHLNIITDSPSVRRRFLDTAISQIRPDYAVKISQYEKIISQRNLLLKNCIKNPPLKETISAWDEQLAKTGTLIHLLRRDYINRLTTKAITIYTKICTGKEELNIEYKSSVFKNYETGNEYSQKNINYYYDKLSQTQKYDLNIGSTSIGIHKDELVLKINGFPLKAFGSQGQKRSAVLALKIAEAFMIQEICNQKSIILLDDVFSELDSIRKEYILNNIKEFQHFSTCCDRENIVSLNEGRIFHVIKGKIISKDVSN